MNIIINILFAVMLANFCVITGCYCIQCVEEMRERRDKANRKDDSK
jgi:hypothetical protein